MKPTAYEMLMAALKKEDGKMGVDTTQPENRHADFMAREIDKIIPPQPQESKGGAA